MFVVAKSCCLHKYYKLLYFFSVIFKKMYIIDNSNCYYSKEKIENCILNMDIFEILQNINSAICDMEEKETLMEANWFIDRLQFELFVVCILRKEEYNDLTMVLNEIEPRKKLYIPGASYDKKCSLKFLMKKSKRKPERKKLFNINLH